MAPKAEPKPKNKRKYNNDRKAKIEAGEDWVYHFKINPLVGLKLIEEQEKHGGEFEKMINNRLAKSFRIKI